MTAERTDLQALVRPFPSKYVHGKPGGQGSYVKAGTVIQRLLHAVGPYQWKRVELIRGDHDCVHENRISGEVKEYHLKGVVTGAIWRLTATVDGQRVSVEGTGDVEHPENSPNDGARAKDAESDALKRAAKHLGVALHVWTQDEFYLHLALEESGQPAENGQRQPA
jgi:Rad52/22 family double-strand break repair protein